MTGISFYKIPVLYWRDDREFILYDTRPVLKDDRDIILLDSRRVL